MVDACLIPEVPFKLPGLFKYLESVVQYKGHAVICVAEGAGQVGARARWNAKREGRWRRWVGKRAEEWSTCPGA